MTIRRRQLPPYIQKIVKSAGRDNVFWTTSLDPKQRPAPGDNVDRLVNAIPDSSPTATQSAASEQPIWKDGEFEFAGDDSLDLGYQIDTSKGWTFAVVLLDNGYSSGSTDYWIGRETVFGDPSIQIAQQGAEKISAQIHDESGEVLKAVFDDGSTSLVQPLVIVVSYRPDDKEFEGQIRTADGDVLGEVRSNSSFSDFQTSDADAQHLAAAANGLGQASIVVGEALEAQTTLTNGEMSGLAEILRTQWRL
jgi:hypothetical protein